MLYIKVYTTYWFINVEVIYKKVFSLDPKTNIYLVIFIKYII